MKRRPLRLAEALIVICAASVGLAASPAGADPGITFDPGLSTDPGTPIAVTGVTVDDGGLANLRVRLEVGGGAGTLSITELTGLGFDEGDGEDDAVIEVRGTEADLNAALATLVFTPAPGFRGEAKITLAVTDGTLTHDGHFYEYVSDPGLTWEEARDAASARTFYGRQGYLATITSPEENDFAAAKLEGEGWIGARAEVVADRQHWRWVTGPESEHPDAEGAGIERGLPFYLGADMTQTCFNPPDMGAVDGRYSNWLDGEPNNCPDELVAYFVVPGGTWNDYPLDSTANDGYVVEFGGLSSDTPEALPSATASITVRTGEVPADETPSTTAPPPVGGTGAGELPPGSEMGDGQPGVTALAFTGDSNEELAAMGAALIAAGLLFELLRLRRSRSERAT